MNNVTKEDWSGGTRSHGFRIKLSVLSVSNTQKPQALLEVLFPVFHFTLFWYQGAFSFFFFKLTFYVFLFLLIKILTKPSIQTNLYDECFRSVMRKYGLS